MHDPFDDPQGRYHVLRNDTAEYSLWPRELTIPHGWHAVLTDLGRDEAIAAVDTFPPQGRAGSTAAAWVLDPLEALTRHAATRPQSLAVLTRDRAGTVGRLTYRQLDRRVSALARRLADHGVAPRDRVAVALPRGPGLVVALLAVLRAGAAYLPLDPGFPADRIALTLQDAAPRLLLTDPAGRALAPEGLPVLLAGADDPAPAGARGAAPGNRRPPTPGCPPTSCTPRAPPAAPRVW